MKYRQLGNSGVRVSAVGIGTDQFGLRVGKGEVREIVATALDQGINFFDTADVYGDQGLSEEYLGAALQGHRYEAVIATKGQSPMGDGPNDRGASRYHLMRALEASLQRLGTDHVDLYQIHWFDVHTPMEETMRALNEMVQSGKARYIGASNYAAWQLCYCNNLADRYGWEPFVTVQPHYHLLEREVERELVPYCRHGNMGILPYFPLAGGLLANPNYRYGAPPPAGTRVGASDWATSYYQRYATRANFTRIDRLRDWAEERGRSLVELAIAWLLGEPLVSSVIAGVSKVAHVPSNARAADWELTAEEMAKVRAVLEEEAAEG